MKTKTLKEETEYIRKNAKYAEIRYAPNSKWVDKTTFLFPILKITFEHRDMFIKLNQKSKLLKEIEKRIKFNPYKDREKRFPRYRVEISTIEFQLVIPDKGEYTCTLDEKIIEKRGAQVADCEIMDKEKQL